MLALVWIFCAFVVALLLLLKFLAIYTMGYCESKVCLVGKTAIVTGGNAGLGYQTALDFASRGCRVIVADVANTDAAVRAIIEQSGNANVRGKFLDVGSLAATRNFARDILDEEPRLDILVNNAGIGAAPAGVRTRDGILKVLQVNHVGGFLLTHLLVPLLKKTPKSRLVFITSFMAMFTLLHKKSKLNRMPTFLVESKLNDLLQYGESKLCNMIVADMFGEKLKQYGIASNSTYPGLVRTNIFDPLRKDSKKCIWYMIPDALFAFVLWAYAKSPYQGAQNHIYTAIDKQLDGVSGKYILDCKPFWKFRKAYDEDIRKLVWEQSEQLAGLSDDEKLN